MAWLAGCQKAWGPGTQGASNSFAEEVTPQQGLEDELLGQRESFYSGRSRAEEMTAQKPVCRLGQGGRQVPSGALAQAMLRSTQCEPWALAKAATVGVPGLRAKPEGREVTMEDSAEQAVDTRERQAGCREQGTGGGVRGGARRDEQGPAGQAALPLRCSQLCSHVTGTVLESEQGQRSGPCTRIYCPLEGSCHEGRDFACVVLY